MKRIVFFVFGSGKSPVQEFLDSLTDKQVEKVLWVLKLVQELDRVPASYFKKLVNTDGIWEVRVTVGGDIFRLLGFMHENSFIVLTNAFQKKTQETPQSEIRLAETRKKEYLGKRR
jgi:phage-related protein